MTHSGPHAGPAVHQLHRRRQPPSGQHPLQAEQALHDLALLRGQGTQRTAYQAALRHKLPFQHETHPLKSSYGGLPPAVCK